MSRIRMTGLSLVIIAAFSAVFAAGASADRVWSFEGSELAINTPKSLKVVKVVKQFELKAGTNNVICKKVTLTGGTIENITGPTGRDKGKVEFSGCANGTCTVAEPIVVKGETTALVEDTGKTKVLDLFTPEGWTEEKPEQIKAFAEIKQTGAGCVAATKVEGTGVAAEITPEGNSKTKILKFPCPAVKEIINWKGTKVKLKLEAFAAKAEFCGEVEVESEGKEFDVK